MTRGAPAAWLHILAVISLVAAALSALVAAIDLLRGHRQQMWIMNLVWPLTMLWAGPLGLLAYFTVGRLGSARAVEAAKRRGQPPPGRTKPFWQSVAVGATHCGSGCTMGDLVAEWFTLLVPITLFGRHVFGTWALDFVLAFAFGIAFQYLTIKPMRDLSVSDGLVSAVKADTLSLIAWQVGMYGWMAIALFVLFSTETLRKTMPEFWFMMQIAMAAGFATSYPVNWFLLRKKIKETM